MEQAQNGDSVRSRSSDSRSEHRRGAGAAAPKAAAPKKADRSRRQRLAAAIRVRLRLYALLAAAGVGLMVVRSYQPFGYGSSDRAALAAAVARLGLTVSPPDIVWLEPSRGPLASRDALLLAHHRGELRDVYIARARVAGSGVVLDVPSLINLSKTSSADEADLTKLGSSVAYTSRVGDRVDGIRVLDTEGEPAALTADWSALARLQNAVRNWQETGRVRGLGVRHYSLIEPVSEATVRARAGRFYLNLDGRRLILSPDRERPLVGGAAVRLSRTEKAVPPNGSFMAFVGWTVDRVRAVSFIGGEPIEWLENRLYNLRDRVRRIQFAWFGSAETTASEVAEDIALPSEVVEDEVRIARLTHTDPVLGWPPGPLSPLITEPRVEGEGRLLPVVDDPFVNAYPNAPPAFFQTFLRVDPERLFARVYITLWDPRQVQLRIQAGTREPESATGHRGRGMVPRERSTLRWLVGAFNGGFQALHGEFGMMAEGRVYLPPKPWAATIGVFRDGRVGMGSWPAPSWRGRFYDERLANRQIPEDLVDMRQNLTSVVEDGTYNPWERWWWGAAPMEATEQTYTTRSGVCLTQDGFMAFFWAQGTGPEQLGAAMVAARCARGMHLDMNSPHCGFEFFRPYPPGEQPPVLRRPARRRSEYDGRFPRAQGWRLRARRAVRSMGMVFPRYASRDARDFFYLVLRPVLPGPPIPIPDAAALIAAPDAPTPAHRTGQSGGAPRVEGREGHFDTSGLPNAGWPHAFARSFLGPADGRTWLLRIDPRRAVPNALKEPVHRRALAYLPNARGADGDFALMAYPKDVGFRFAVGPAPSGPGGEPPHTLVRGARLRERPDATRALGVDRDGFLVYAEREGGEVTLVQRLSQAGVRDAIVLPDRMALVADQGYAAVDGYTALPVTESEALAFWAEERRATEVLFPENEPMPYSRWSYLQGRRVRYFPEGPPRFTRPQP